MCPNTSVAGYLVKQVYNCIIKTVYSPELYFTQ